MFLLVHPCSSRTWERGLRWFFLGPIWCSKLPWQEVTVLVPIIKQMKLLFYLIIIFYICHIRKAPSNNLIKKSRWITKAPIFKWNWQTSCVIPWNYRVALMIFFNSGLQKITSCVILINEHEDPCYCDASRKLLRTRA